MDGLIAKFLETTEPSFKVNVVVTILNVLLFHFSIVLRKLIHNNTI